MEELIEVLKGIQEAIEEQNELLKSCIGQPENQPARFLAEVTGQIDTLPL